MSTERGFTVLEVLIAFTIAALATSVLLQASLGGLQAAGVAGRYEEATSRARSHLAALGTALAPSDTEDEDGSGYHWHLRVAPIASVVVGADVAGRTPVRATLYSISVAISWRERERTRLVELDSKRIGTTPVPQ